MEKKVLVILSIPKKSGKGFKSKEYLLTHNQYRIIRENVSKANNKFNCISILGPLERQLIKDKKQLIKEIFPEGKISIKK